MAIKREVSKSMESIFDQSSEINAYYRKKHCLYVLKSSRITNKSPSWLEFLERFHNKQFRTNSSSKNKIMVANFIVPIPNYLCPIILNLQKSITMPCIQSTDYQWQMFIFDFCPPLESNNIYKMLLCQPVTQVSGEDVSLFSIALDR